MRAFLPGARVALGAFLAAAALAAYGQGAPKPDTGAGPHRDYQPMEGGNGESLRPGAPQPQFPKPAPEPAGTPSKSGASAGSSAKPSDTQSPEDERRATERMEKSKKRPGFQQDAPSPRASRGAGGGVN
jgi:hypothetical protein